MIVIAFVLLGGACVILLLAISRLRGLIGRVGGRDGSAEAIARDVARKHGIPVVFGRAAAMLQEQCRFDSSPPAVLLSARVATSTSPAAVALALHELGHAAQINTHDGWLRLRLALAPVAWLATMTVLPAALLVGLTAAMVLFCVSLVCAALLLPSELDASARAMAWMRERGIPEREASAALEWAFVTYLAAPVLSPIQIVAFLLSGLSAAPNSERLAPGSVAALGAWLRSPWFWAALVAESAIAIWLFRLSAPDPNALAEAMRVLRSLFASPQ